MRTLFTQEQLLAAYQNAPQAVQDALSRPGPTMDFVDSLRSKNVFGEQAVTTVIELVRDTLLDLITSTEFANELRAVVAKKEDADALIKDFNETVLVPLREQPVVHVSQAVPPAPTPSPEIARAQWQKVTPKVEPAVNRLETPAPTAAPPPVSRPAPVTAPAPMPAKLVLPPTPTAPVVSVLSPVPATKPAASAPTRSPQSVPVAAPTPKAAAPAVAAKEPAVPAKSTPSSEAKVPTPVPTPPVKADPYREPVE